MKLMDFGIYDEVKRQAIFSIYDIMLLFSYIFLLLGFYMSSMERPRQNFVYDHPLHNSMSFEPSIQGIIF